MSNQDFEGLDDLWTAIKKHTTSGHVGPNNGRIFDGCIFVTQKEWDAISKEPRPVSYSQLTAIEKLGTIPIRIIPNGGSQELSDGRVLMAFDNTLYLLTEPSFKPPPLPRLYIDGVYI